MKWAVTGANGQLGSELRQLSEKLSLPDVEWIFWDRQEMDLTDPSQIKAVMQAHQPDVLINCAAYTAVDQAEREVGDAYAINEKAIDLLAQECKKIGCKCVHISTDYVYHLDQNTPLLETDNCEPQGIYGKSKWGGEQALAQSGVDYIILRVSWLYSSFQKNFVKTMLRLGTEKDALQIVNDQWGAPTYAADLAEAIVTILQHPNLDEKWGNTYNFSNSGKTNWAEFAKAIFTHADISCKVTGISTAQYNAPAPRPLWSVMSKEKIRADFDIKLNSWEESLHRCLAQLQVNA